MGQLTRSRRVAESKIGGGVLSSLPMPHDGLVPVCIETDDGEYRFECPPDRVILYEALRAGIPLAYSCATGTCGTCAVRVLEGSVTNLWPQAPALSREARGRVLACQSGASAPLRLRGSLSSRSARRALIPSTYLTGFVAHLTWPAPGIAEVWLEMDASLAFVPGQYVLVWFEGVRGPRALSISNTDASPARRIRLFVRPRDGSALHALLRSGRTERLPLRAFGALGNACLDDETAKGEITCVAGSTGIAPMLPILSRWVDHSVKATGRVVYGVRRSADAVGLEDLRGISGRAHGRLSTVIALSEPGDGQIQAMQRQLEDFAHVVGTYAHEAVQGILNGGRLEGLAFVAGPKPMVQATVKTLVLQGRLNPAAIRSDDFG